MPVGFLSAGQRSRYGVFNAVPDIAQLGAFFHLDADDRRRYATVRRFLPKLLKHLDFDAGAAETSGQGARRGHEVLAALDFLKAIERRRTDFDPREVPWACCPRPGAGASSPNAESWPELVRDGQLRPLRTPPPAG
ncbi:hypothetical protein AB0395_47185 [Streptosporangium sp. NPDC051023]|uniref:hypothetical protein n=1 Tax=Streptosporangium sp. NPDC051023 TaxID=3155410 RepID=UPI00344C9EB5